MPKQPSLEDRVTLEVGASSDPKGYYIVKVLIDGVCLVGVWCDRISVYLGEPPCYCLYHKELNVAAFASKLLTVKSGAKTAISDEALKALGKCAEIKP